MPIICIYSMHKSTQLHSRLEGEWSDNLTRGQKNVIVVSMERYDLLVCEAIFFDALANTECHFPIEDRLFVSENMLKKHVFWPVQRLWVEKILREKEFFFNVVIRVYMVSIPSVYCNKDTR